MSQNAELTSTVPFPGWKNCRRPLWGPHEVILVGSCSAVSYAKEVKSSYVVSLCFII